MPWILAPILLFVCIAFFLCLVVFLVRLGSFFEVVDELVEATNPYGSFWYEEDEEKKMFDKPKLDLVMWTKNGEKTLPLVLRQIDEVIPKENVNAKILVDDHSVDDTIKIAKDFNWQVYENPATGIPSGANEALRHNSLFHIF